MKRMVFALAVLVQVTACSGGEVSGAADEPPTASAGLTAATGTGATSGTAATGVTGSTDTYGDLPGLVVYQTLNGDHESIWLIRPDGSDERLLLGQDHDAVHPRWSFDGERLVYEDCPPTGADCRLVIVEADGSNPETAYECGDECYGGSGPSLSPDGILAFTRYFDGDPSVEPPARAALTVGPPGGPFEDLTSERQLPSGFSDQFPRWSPDGSHLVFFRERLEDEQIVATALFTIASDGSDLQRLTDWGMNAGNPDWSPNGSTIVFNTNPIVDFGTGPSDIYTIEADGSGMTQLTDFSADGFRADQPTFTSDGEVIFFTLEMGPGSKQLWAMRSDGTQKAQLTTSGLYTHAQLQPR